MLGPRDLVATIVAAASTYVGYLALKRGAYPFHVGNRSAVVFLLAAGLASCIAFAPKEAPQMSNPLVLILFILGGLAFLVTIIGLIKPSTTVVALLAGMIILMWLLSTIGHLTV